MIKLKIFKQSYGFCGPACFKMVMDYYGVKQSEMYWARLTAMEIKNGKVNRNEGCPDDKFVVAVAKIGFKGFCKDNSSIVEVKKFIKKKVPVIVNWFSPEQGAHFSVVVGLEKDKIFLADPYLGKVIKLTVESFADRWFDHMPYPIKSLRQFKWVRRICAVYR
ncbi:MAG: papain-like cysteine protease family protein [Patescibacteria group bacterium]|jgi:ABC-type bacteriocin/lantibiotic exporter with double-glycine peptidase domain